MMISMLPSNVFAADFDADMFVEPAVEAVSVPAEEPDVESTVEYIYEEPAETLQGSSDEIQTVEAADPAADEIEEETEAPVVDGTVTLKAEGSDYTVTVTYDASALLPDDVKVTVEEIKANAKKYDDYCDQALEAVQQENADVEELSYTRLFDIKLVDADGNPLEPASAVDVQIRLKDVETVEENTQIVHFAGEEETPEVIEPTVENDTVAFATEGFSIYAVVSTGEFARLTVNFNKSASDTTTMYVKKQDITDGNLNQVLYDPGVPVAEGKKFLGWTDNENWTNHSIDELKEEAMTIDDVRKAVTTRLNGGVTDGDFVTYNAIMVNCFELYYQDEGENTFKTENLLSTTNSATTTVYLAYTATGGSATESFIGWKDKDTETVYKNGDPITITKDTTLVPKLGQGKWIYFDENDGGSGGGADYTRPVFVPAGELATDYKPADPTRPGYKFAGWYKGAADSAEKYEFNTNLSEFTGTEVKLYAHWTPSTHASYKVIIWKQKVTDNKNAADADKTYDYLESHTVEEVATDTPITAETLSQYLSYGNTELGATDLANGSYGFKTPARFEIENGSGAGKNGVSADDSTIVNVYYDRAVFALRFKGTSGGTPSYEPVDSGSNVYGLVNGQYVPLTTTVSNKRIVWTRYSGELAVPESFTQVLYSSKSKSSSLLYRDQLANVGGLYYNGSKLIDQEVGKTAIQASIGNSPTQFYLYTTESEPFGDYCQLRWTIAGDYSYTYEGEPYTGQLYKQTSEIVYTGLYGQSFKEADPNYEWIMPDSTHHWTQVSYLDAFNGNIYGGKNVGKKPNMIEIEKSDNTSDIIKIVFWEQNTDLSGYTKADSALYTCVSTAGFNITERVKGMTPSGYLWSMDESMPTTWKSAAIMDSSTDGINAKGFTNVKRGSNTVLHVKNDRVTNDIVFMYGSDVVGQTEGIAYGVSLADYKNTTPDASKITVPENQYFVGWYDNPEGVGDPYDWSETMPLGNKLIYAITKPVQYHVKVEMNGGEVQNQSTDFRVSYGTIIADTNFMQATKTVDGSKYSLVGYYTDEAFTNLWNFSSKVTADSLWHTYTGPDDQMRVEYGDAGRDQTVGIFKLFARWRNDDILKQGGLNIRYRNNPEALDNLYVDSMHYADLSDVIAAQAPEKTKWPEGKRFDGWKLAAGEVYQPGDIFVADSKDANKEDGTYWITLTATYVETENRTPTHITWYKNDGSGESYDTSPDLSINAKWPVFGTSIYPKVIGQTIPTRTGYKFLGWARDVETPVDAEGNPQTGDDGGLIVNTETEETTANFLEYREADGKFYVPGTNREVTHVAADEVLPYHGLYAIWKDVQIHIYHSSDGSTEDIQPTTETVDLTSCVKKNGYIYGGYYEYEKDDETTDDGDPVHRGKAITSQPGTAVTPEAGKTYYLKEVPDTYLNPRIFITYDKNEGHAPKYALRGLYAIMDLDTSCVDGDGKVYGEYGGYGFIVGDDIQSTTLAGFICEKLEVKYPDKDKPDTYTMSSLYGDIQGRLAVSDLTENYLTDTSVSEFKLRAYFKTQDGVIVTGKKQRIVHMGDRVFASQSWNKTDWEEGENGIWQETPKDDAGNYTPGSEAVAATSRSLGASTTIPSVRTYQIKSAPDILTYTVTKVDDGKNESQVVQAGDNTGKITYAGKTGYVFAGWYLDKAYTKAADFSVVTGDMTVYAKYVKATAIGLSFTKKSSKSGSVTLNATLKITGAPDLTDAAVSCDYKGKTSTVKFTGAKTTKSVKTTVSTYTGTVAISGLANKSSFTAAISYKTPDGTIVILADKTCKYTSGKVTVK